MKFKKSFSKCLLASKMMIEDYLFKCSNRISPSYFTRSGKMGFKETILFMLNMINKSIQVELNNFFEGLLKKDDSISKQAFSSVRIIKFDLESGVEEVLVTNLFNEFMTESDFKELYFMRWGIEIKYDELKNRFEVENFTGTTKIAIEQDFYASIYRSNMIELARKDSDEIIAVERENKENKYEYKTNVNILIGSLKDKLIMMFLEDSPRKRKKFIRIL